MKEMIESQIVATLELPRQVGKWKAYECYKDSGIAWLGKIPEHWEVRRLKCTVLGCQNGVWGDEPTHDEKDIFCIRVADFNRLNHRVSGQNLTIRSIQLGQRQNRVLRQGDLLIEKSGGGDLQPVGAVILYDLESPSVCSNFIARMRVVKGHHAPFLCYLHTALYEARINTISIKQNTGIQNLDTDSYLSEKVSLPVFCEQRSITAFLDRETAKINMLIAKKERVIELLQERRTAIINQAVTKGLIPDVSMKNSGVEWLGEIPAHWEVRRLKHSIYSIEQGWSPSCENRLADAEEWGVLKVGCVNGIEFNDDEHKALPKDLEPIPELEIKTGDILMSRANTRELLGSTSIVRQVRPRLLLCDKLYRFKINSKVLGSEFFVISMKTSIIRFQLERDATGASSSMQNIAQSTILNLILPHPDTKEQEEIVSFLSTETAKIDKLISGIQDGIKKLKEYCTALISAAVTGKIDVRAEVANMSAEDAAI
jgi:type I restriction enzyme S subunit